MTDDRPAGPGGPDQNPDASKRDYWTEVPRFLRLWARHEDKWPEEKAAAVDPSKDPEGSWRGKGNQYLSPEEHAEAKAAIVAVRQAARTLTRDIGAVARENTCGGWVEGLKFRLKGEERLKEKIADLKETSAPDASLQEILGQIPDAVRYTFCAERQNYCQAYQDIKQRLESSGHQMRYSENHWPQTQYKGINTRWVTPEGQQFEVQFHTPESYHAKQEVTHQSYERLRNPLTGGRERTELHAFQAEVCSWITKPQEVTGIPSYRKGDR